MAWMILSGCSVPTVEVAIPPEFLEGARALLVSVENDDQILQLSVGPPADASLSRILPGGIEYQGESLRVSVARSERSFADLGLPEGPLAPSNEDVGPTRPVLSLYAPEGGLELLTTTVNQDEVSDWAIGQPSHKLAGFPVPKKSLCEPPNTQVFNAKTEATTSIRNIVLTGPRTALFAGTGYVRTTTVWRIESAISGTMELDPTATLEIGAPAYVPDTISVRSMAGHEEPFLAFDASGQFLLLEANGDVLERIPAPNQELYTVAQGVDGSMFAFGYTYGKVYELVRGSSTAVPRPDFPADVRALSVFRRDRMIVAVGERRRTGAIVNLELAVFEGNTWSSEHRESQDVLSPSVLAHESGFAALLNADVLLREDATWRRFTGRELGTETTPRNGIAPLGEGRYLTIGDLGLASIYDPRQGWCDIVVGSLRGLNRLSYDPKSLRHAVASEESVLRLDENGAVTSLAEGSSVTWFELYLD